MFRVANMYNQNQIKIASTQLQSLSFFGTHAKPHGVIRLNKHYLLLLDSKLGQGKCAIKQIPYTCISCTNMLYKPWVINSDPIRQPRYQPVEYCTYWPVLVSFNNWDIVKFTNKSTTNEDFDEVHKVVLDSISDNMYALVQNGKYGEINTADPTTMGY